MKHLVFVGLILFSLVSCKIVHSTSFNTNNSGEISIYIDMKEFAEKMGKGVSKKTEEKLAFDSKKNENLDTLTMVEYIGQTIGISNVSTIVNKKKYTYGLNLKFDNPVSLNEAMNKIQHYVATGKDSSAVLKTFEYYHFSDKKLTLKEPLKKKSDSQEGDESNEKLEKMTEMISMQWEVSFAERKIKKVNSTLEVIQNGKKQVTLKIDGNEMSKRDSETIATIDLK